MQHFPFIFADNELIGWLVLLFFIIVPAIGQLLAKLRAAYGANQATWLEESRQAHQQLIADIDGHLQARRYYQAWRLLESERATRVTQPASAAPERALVLPVAAQEPAAGAIVAKLDFDEPGDGDLTSRGFSMNKRGGELFVLREGVGRGGSRSSLRDRDRDPRSRSR